MALPEKCYQDTLKGPLSSESCSSLQIQSRRAAIITLSLPALQMQSVNINVNFLQKIPAPCPMCVLCCNAGNNHPMRLHTTGRMWHGTEERIPEQENEERGEYMTGRHCEWGKQEGERRDHHQSSQQGDDCGQERLGGFQRRESRTDVASFLKPRRQQTPSATEKYPPGKRRCGLCLPNPPLPSAFRSGRDSEAHPAKSSLLNTSLAPQWSSGRGFL